MLSVQHDAFAQTILRRYTLGNIGSTACFISGNHNNGGFGMVIRGFLDNNPDGPDDHPNYGIEDKYSVSGTLTEYSNNTAVLTANLVNLDNAQTTFTLNLNLTGRTGSATSHTGCFNPTAANSFYTGVSGSISGQDATGAGVSATVTNDGNIQLGPRNFYCADLNCEEIAGWFTFSNISGPATTPSVVDMYMKLTPFPSGSLQINKAVTNKPAGFSSPNFSILVDCSDDGFDQTLTLTDGNSQTISNIPVGVTCTITEPSLPTAPSGYAYGTPTISPNSVTIADGVTSTVTVTNPLFMFPTGSISGPTSVCEDIVQNYQVVGNPGGSGPLLGRVRFFAAPIGTTDFVGYCAANPAMCAIFDLNPTVPTTTQTANVTFTTPGNYWVLMNARNENNNACTGNPNCTFNGGTTLCSGNTDCGPNDWQVVTVLQSNDPSCTTLGVLQITKAVTNAPGGFNPLTEFPIIVSCSNGYSNTFQVRDGELFNTPGLPIGTTCTVTEGALPLPPTGYDYGTPVISPTGPYTITASPTITVTVTNPLNAITCPTITVTPNPLSSGTVGSSYSASPIATASDGGTYTYTWSGTGLPTGLSVNSSSGAVSGTPTTVGTGTVLATATIAGQTCTGNTTVAVNAAPVCPTITVAPNPLPDAEVGSAYSASPLATASDGGTYTYTWSSTNLPTGLIVNNSSGVVSGIASTSGSGTVTATATILGLTCSGSTSLRANLTPSCPTITVTPNPLSSGTVGSSYSASPIATASDGGTYTYTWSGTGLPTGLSVNSSSGAVSGTPTTVGTGTVLATATIAGQTCTGNTSLTVLSSIQTDLELIKTVDKTVVQPGDMLTYTLTLTNKGPSIAPDVKVRDVIPSGLTFVSANPSQGTYTVATGIWDLGTVAVGSATLTITVRVN